MNEVLEYFIGAVIICSAHIYIWSNVLNKKFNYKKTINYLYIFILFLCVIGSYVLINNSVRIVVSTFILMIFAKLIFEENIKKSVMLPVYSQFIIMISEVILSIIVLGIFRVDKDFAINNLFASILSNLSVSIISIYIAHFKIVKKVYQIILEKIDRIKPNTLLLIVFLMMLTINIVFTVTYYKASIITLLIINILMILIYTFIIFKILEEKNNIIKLTSKYNTTLDSLKEYEDILNKYRILNHENKNQLLTIRNMINSKDKKIINHIDKLIGNKKKNDEQLMQETSIIPPGGLRAVVYSKILEIKESEIKYFLSLDKQLSTVDLVELGDDTLLDICNIMNVFLDNAIDASKESKDKSIGIQMYIEENELFVEISNTYSNSIDIDKISNVGYTTKENGHGYGLTLVKQIIDKNKRLENIKKCEGNMFVQILKIKM